MKSAADVLSDLTERGLLGLVYQVGGAFGETSLDLCGRRKTDNLVAARLELWQRILNHPQRRYSISEIAEMFGRVPSSVNVALRCGKAVAHQRTIAQKAS